MNREILEILKNAYETLGDDIFLDNKRLGACLNDLLIQYPKDLKRLSLLVNESIVYKIITEVSASDTNKALMYIKIISENYMMNEADVAPYVNCFLYAVKGVEIEYHNEKDEDDEALFVKRQELAVILKKYYQCKLREKKKAIQENKKVIEQQKQKNSICSFVVEDFFAIAGRGIVLAGKVTNGEFRVGDSVYIDGKKVVKILAMESFRKLIDVAKKGQGIGMLLKGVSKDELYAGMTICKVD